MVKISGVFVSGHAFQPSVMGSVVHQGGTQVYVDLIPLFNQSTLCMETRHTRYILFLYNGVAMPFGGLSLLKCHRSALKVSFCIARFLRFR
jgi:hypothetical protein